MTKISTHAFVNTLLFLFPIGINTLKVSGDLILFLLAIVGVVQYLKGGFKDINQSLFQWFCFATIGYFLVLIISVVFSGKPAELMRYLARDLHFLFAPLVFVACATVKINVRLFFLGIKFSLVLMGLIVSYQYLDGIHRPSGVMNAATFGNLAVMTLFFLVGYSLVYRERVNWLSLLAFVLGIAAVILSGTRGALLSAVLMFGMCVAFALVYLSISKKFFVLALCGVLGGAIYLGVANDSASQRLTAAYKNSMLWFEGENKFTSVGLRLEMYKASILALEDMPLLTGYGYRNANPIVANYAHPSTQSAIAGFNHLHNAYISSLLFNGLIGLAALLLLLFFPVRYFYKSLHAEGSSRMWGFCGLLLCFGYASFGLVNILFGDVFMNAFYAFYIALIFSSLVKESNSSDFDKFQAVNG